MIRQELIDFFNQWPLDKERATEIIKDNKTFNIALKAGEIPGKSHPEDKKTFSLYGVPSAKNLSVNLPSLLHGKAGIPESKFKIQGSIGQGNPAEIPWMCVFDKEITTSAQEGFYIVYLFKSDLSGVYLSLNQGWTQYEREFGVKEGRIEIRKNADLAKKLLRSDQGFSYEAITLGSSRPLGRGYEEGNICSVYYDKNDLPSEEDLINDIRNLIGVYRELKGLVGSEILEIKGSLDEDEFQEAIQESKRKELEAGAVSKKGKSKNSQSSSWARDSNISFTALDNADFTCENESSHLTFISAKTGKQFMEAHHLIPMEYQGEFEFSIDVPENIVCLCPNCHRAFHNSESNYREQLLNKFFEMREAGLAARKIHITKDQLINYYLKTTPNK